MPQLNNARPTSRYLDSISLALLEFLFHFKVKISSVTFSLTQVFITVNWKTPPHTRCHKNAQTTLKHGRQITSLACNMDREKLQQKL